jgi:hypothetical protein
MPLTLEERHVRELQAKREEYARRKAAGLCISCEGPVPEGGRSSVCCPPCLEKRTAINARCRKENPGRGRRKMTLRDRIKKYGITHAEYDRMVAAQAGRCAICQRADTGTGRGWYIDHDHATGAVRGLLCHGCNSGLGHFRDNPLSLQRAIRYLLRSRSSARKEHCDAA